MVPQNACTVLRVAEILHCVSFPSQQKHVCFSRHEHFVQTPDLNISMGSDFQIVSLMTRFFLCCCWILVTHAVFFPLHEQRTFCKIMHGTIAKLFFFFNFGDALIYLMYFYIPEFYMN